MYKTTKMCSFFSGDVITLVLLLQRYEELIVGLSRPIIYMNVSYLLLHIYSSACTRNNCKLLIF